MQCPVCGAGTEEMRGEEGGPRAPGAPEVPGGPGEFRTYGTPVADEDLWVSRTMMPGSSPDDDRPLRPFSASGSADSPGSSGSSRSSRSSASNSKSRSRSASADGAPASRKRLLTTLAVVALGCLGVTVAVVAGTGGGDGDGATGAGQPSRVGSPELPGLGGEVTPSTIPGNAGGGGGNAGEGGAGQAGGVAPGPGASATTDPPASSPPPEDGPGAGEWAGPGCTTGKYREHGRFENGKAAWYTVHSGGYKGSSCDGRFSAVPMSGSPKVDGRSSAVWSWKLDASYEKCALAVYVPDSGRDADAAGDPTVYQVLADPADSASGFATFGVRQVAHRGSLVQVGSYPVKGKTFAVRLVDRGQDWGSEERVGAHHAAAQMRVKCA
ncbi:adhesin [Streptomyces sp. NPDC056987]|uniref:adhesin n=1 Tax=Streptomyces sp. NPDC056987 TaxID=3345988 RepID=UPI003628C5EB